MPETPIDEIEKIQNLLLWAREEGFMLHEVHVGKVKLLVTDTKGLPEQQEEDNSYIPDIGGEDSPRTTLDVLMASRGVSLDG